MRYVIGLFFAIIFGVTAAYGQAIGPVRALAGDEGIPAAETQEQTTEPTAEFDVESFAHRLGQILALIDRAEASLASVREATRILSEEHDSAKRRELEQKLDAALGELLETSKLLEKGIRELPLGGFTLFKQALGEIAFAPDAEMREYRQLKSLYDRVQEVDTALVAIVSQLPREIRRLEATQKHLRNFFRFREPARSVKTFADRLREFNLGFSGVNDSLESDALTMPEEAAPQAASEDPSMHSL